MPEYNFLEYTVLHQEKLLTLLRSVSTAPWNTSLEEGYGKIVYC